MSKKIVIITILTSIFLSVNTVNAQGPNPTAQPPIGYGKETNLEWFEICDPDDHSEYQSGFYPTTYPILENSTFSEPIYSNNEFILLSNDIPIPYQQEGLIPHTYLPIIGDQCVWHAYVDPQAIPGDTYENSYTAPKEFTHDIEYADVSFTYSCNDLATLGLLWRPYEIVTRWNDDLETTINGNLCETDAGDGYISTFVEPRPGNYISRIYVNFPTIDLGLLAAPLQMLPMPSLAIDRVLIRGFYQLNPPTPTPTGTPTATRTPTTTRTPTVTATPRNLWDTPTPTPTGVLTPTATPTGVPTQIFDWEFPMPTKIPAIRFPAWPTPPTVAPLLSTPAELLSLPLITPVYTATPTLVPLDFTIVLSYPTPGVFQTPTATATPEGTPSPGEECFEANFAAAELPAGWTISTGTFVPGSGIQFTADGSNRLVIFNSVREDTYTSISIYASNAGYPYNLYFPTSDNLHQWGEAFNSSTYGYPPPYQHDYDGYTFRIELTGASGNAYITSAPFCIAVDPTPTPTPTATPTLDDFIGPLATLSLNLQTEADAMSNTITFTVETAPPEYAPNLPRPMANVGYTFENMPPEAGLGFGITAWSSLLGYAASIPFQLAKFMLTLADLLGPLGLFIKWLFILLPFVFFVKIYLFVKNLIISLINLIIKIVNFIGDIWDLIPGL